MSKPLDSLARAHTEEAVRIIREVMTDTFAENRDRLAAAKEMLDRGHGKAVNAVIQVPANRAAAALLAAMDDDALLAIIRNATLPRLREPVIDAEYTALPAPRDPLLE